MGYGRYLHNTVEIVIARGYFLSNNMKINKIYDRKNSRPKKFFNDRYGQAFLEFTITFVATLLLFYGTVMVFRWIGVDLVRRRVAHDNLLTTPINPSWGSGKINEGPLKQVDPFFSQPARMRSVFGE